jgi:hypothetical protein
VSGEPRLRHLDSYQHLLCVIVCVSVLQHVVKWNYSFRGHSVPHHVPDSPHQRLQMQTPLWRSLSSCKSFRCPELALQTCARVSVIVALCSAWFSSIDHIFLRVHFQWKHDRFRFPNSAMSYRAGIVETGIALTATESGQSTVTEY